MRAVRGFLFPAKGAGASILSACALAIVMAAPAVSSTSYELSWHTIDGGGGTSIGGPYKLTGTIGQPDADWCSGGEYELLGGFWPGGPIPECFPSTYSTYNDWVALGKPDCWCRPYQCDGDVDGATETPLKFRIYGKDLALVVANWKKKINDPTLDPCADIDHKSETPLEFRIYGKDLATVVSNWKKKDAELSGNCPRPE